MTPEERREKHNKAMCEKRTLNAINFQQPKKHRTEISEMKEQDPQSHQVLLAHERELESVRLKHRHTRIARNSSVMKTKNGDAPRDRKAEKER